MVRGLELFTEYFRDYKDSYILIGGAATDVWMEEYGAPFRATKDLDIIIVIEVLNEKFVKLFWEFIEKGKYKMGEKSDGEPRVYRFMKPDDKDYPYQIEIFSRKPDILGDFEKAHLAPIPLGEELGSLSAILMNDDYYKFTKEHSDVFEDLHLATPPAIICLKAKAVLDIKERLDKEDWKDNNEKSKLKKDYKKHRNDIIRITFILTGDDEMKLEDPMKEDVLNYMEIIKADPPNFKQLAENFEVEAIDPEDIIEQLKTTFNI